MQKLQLLLISTALFLGVVLVGVTIHQPSPAAATHGTVTVQVLDPSLQRFAISWQQEVARRFPDAEVILVHGGDFIEGEWLCSNRNFGHYTRVTDVIEHYRKSEPDRTIVVLACNTGHIHLHGYPNVYFALASVWCLPDRAVGDDPENAMRMMDTGYDPVMSRWGTDPEVVGNVFELVEAR